MIATDHPEAAPDCTRPGGPAPEILAQALREAGARGRATVVQKRAPAPAHLLLLGGPRKGSALPLGEGVTTVGRGESNTVVIPDISVSRQHVRLEREGGGFVLYDRGSGNGTRVNGKAVERRTLRHGDELELGDARLRFVAPKPRGRGVGRRALPALLVLSATLATVAIQRRQIEPATEVQPAAVADPPAVAVPEPRVEPAHPAQAEAARPARAERRRAPATPVRKPREALAAYAAGDLALAIGRASEDPALLARLRSFEALRRDGLAAREPLEAIRLLEGALAVDRGIAGGEDGPLARGLRKALSSLHTRAAASLPEADLPRSADHLRRAVEDDAGNRSAAEGLQRIEERCRELYLRGYVAKDEDAATARSAFRMVIASLPPSDETARKAKRWLDQLDGKGADHE